MKSKSCKLMLVKYLRDGHRKTQRRVRRNVLEKIKSEKSNVLGGKVNNIVRCSREIKEDDKHVCWISL